MTDNAFRPNGAALRRGRWSQPGGIYLVTTSTENRFPLFFDSERARATCRSFRGGPCGGVLLAWVLMPDHAHWVIALGDEPLGRAVWRLKSDSTRALRELGYDRSPWQRGFHDRAMRAGDDLRKIARYVVMNPVRAGLVRRPGDYPYWDAVWI